MLNVSAFFLYKIKYNRYLNFTLLMKVVLRFIYFLQKKFIIRKLKVKKASKNPFVQLFIKK